MFLQILAGLTIGYLTVSICESFFHRTIQHASPQFRKVCASMPIIGPQFLSAWLSHHVVHHCMTYRRDHVSQFVDPDEKLRLRHILVDKGHAGFVKRDYGAKIGGADDVLFYIAPTVPVYLSVCYAGGLWFTLGAAFPFLLWPLFAQFVHPYLHMKHTEAMRRAPFLIRLLIQTPYYRYLFRHHWLHHKHMDCNFNLVLGGDFFLGRHRRPTSIDLDAIKEFER